MSPGRQKVTIKLGVTSEATGSQENKRTQMVLAMRDTAMKPVTPKLHPRKLPVTSCLSPVKGGCCYCSCSVAKACLTLCDPVDCSIQGSSVFHCLPAFAQIRVH